MKILVMMAEPVMGSYLCSEFSKDSKDEIEFFHLETSNNFDYNLDGLNFDLYDQVYLFGNADYHNHSRLGLFSQLISLGVRPNSYISNKASVSDLNSIGLSTVIYPGACIDAEVKIGFNALIMPNAFIGIGTKVAKNVYIGTNAVLGKRCVIGNNVFIDDGVRLSDNVKVGSNSIIKDCAHIKNDIPDGTIIDSSIGDYVRIFS